MVKRGIIGLVAVAFMLLSVGYVFADRTAHKEIALGPERGDKLGWDVPIRYWRCALEPPCSIWVYSDLLWNTDGISTRFTTVDPCTLKYAYVRGHYGTYSQGNPEMRLFVWDDDGTGLPGVVLDSSATTWDTTTDYSMSYEPMLVLTTTEFHIGAKVEPGLFPADTAKMGCGLEFLCPNPWGLPCVPALTDSADWRSYITRPSTGDPAWYNTVEATGDSGNWVIHGTIKYGPQCVDEIYIPSDVMGPQGAQVHVPVYGNVCGMMCLGNMEGLDGVIFGVDFDPDVFDVDTVIYETTDPTYTSFYDLIPTIDHYSVVKDNVNGRLDVGIVFKYAGSPDIPPGEYKMFDCVFNVDPATPVDVSYPLTIYVGPKCGPPFIHYLCGVRPVLIDGSIYVFPGPQFIRGDVDGSGSYTLGDGLFFLNYFIAGSPTPGCMDAADINDSGDLTLADGLWFLNYFITGSPLIPPPSGSPPDACGSDPTDDDLDCAVFPPCGTGTKAKVVASVPVASFKGASEKVIVSDAVAKDGEVVVPVELVNVEDITGVDITLGYDASVLEAEKVEGGEGYGYFVGYIGDAGRVRIGIVPDLEMEEVIGAGERVIAEVVFKLKGSLSSDVEIRVESADLYGRGVKQVRSEWVGGLVKAGVGLPEEFALRQNYPNPFNPITEIKYDLPVDCQVRLDVYNVVGQRVATLVDAQQKAGYRIARWDASSFSSGIYFYRLQAGDFVQTRKMVVLK